MTDLAAVYGHAIVALSGWAVLMLGLAIAAVAVPCGEKTASGHPVRNYGDRGYRAHRAQMNAIEAAGPFIAVTAAAILAGGPPFWVNLLASIFLVARVATAAVHIGTTNEPARSATWSVGVLCILGLAGIAAWAALTA